MLGLARSRRPSQKYLFCLASWSSVGCWPRTWCAATSAASGWPSATWTWPPGDRHPPGLRQAHGLRGQLRSSSAWLARCGASSTWARGSRRPSSTARSSCCSWSSSAALGSIMGSFFGAAFIVVLPIVLDQLPARTGRHPDRHRIRRPSRRPDRAHDLRRLIVFFLIVEPHGPARLWPIGKEKLRLWPFPTDTRRLPRRVPFHPNVQAVPFSTMHDVCALAAAVPLQTGCSSHEPATRRPREQFFPPAGVPHRRARAERRALGQRQTWDLKMINAATAASTASRSPSRNARPATPPTAAWMLRAPQEAGPATTLVRPAVHRHHLRADREGARRQDPADHAGYGRVGRQDGGVPGGTSR